jgi:ArsR family transcriptional regulator, arsenate/arsenite/antimonite-responsive transcriptional repressor
METKNVITALSALAQETRLAIFRLLVETGPGGLAVGTIAEALAVPNATLSFHLKELSNANLLTATQNGRSIRYEANFDAMTALLGYLTENCCAGAVCTEGSSCTPQAATVCNGEPAIFNNTVVMTQAAATTQGTNTGATKRKTTS